MLTFHSDPCPPKGQDFCPDAVTQDGTQLDAHRVFGAFHAFVTFVLHLLRVKTAWDLLFRCFVSSLKAWAKFLCLPVLLFSLSAQLLQILIFWLPYLGFVLSHLNETTFTTLCSNWHMRFPSCSCCSPLFQVHVHVSFTPLQDFGFSSSQDSKALSPSQNSYFAWL